MNYWDNFNPNYLNLNQKLCCVLTSPKKRFIFLTPSPVTNEPQLKPSTSNQSMNLFDTAKQSFSMNPTQTNRESIGCINTNLNNNNPTTKPSNIAFLSNIQSNPSTNPEHNIELFLRHRSELYFQNNDYDTALFYSERLLSQNDNLYNRLLVAKCYNSLTKYNRAYNVLQSIVRQTQTQYQRFIQSQIQLLNTSNNGNNNNNNNRNHSHEIDANISFGIDPLTPISRKNDDGHIITDIGFAFNNAIINDDNNNSRSIVSESNKTNNMNDTSFGASFLKKLENKNNQISNNKSEIIEKINLENGESISILSESRYFISLICFKLGRYDECEEYLLGFKTGNEEFSNSEIMEIPNGVFGIYLLAKVFHKSHRINLAIKYYNQCIALDSYHIGAINALCDLGINPSNANNILNEKCDEKIKLLFTNLIYGYFNLRMYNLGESLKYFNNLNAKHFESSFVLNCTALCYYEMNDYSRAVINWNKMCNKYPFCMTGLDYYSTALWHLKKSKELTLLSQHCSEIDKNSIETWIVMGNCFSLHKSHDLAIKFFKKSATIGSDNANNESYAYSYTLAGHEYVVNEDFDNAFKSFETAIRINNRHYNAWYGLANIYQFQQNYNNALYHFNKAIEINPNSSVLYVCVASIYKLKLKYKLALKYANKALKLTQINGNYNLKARLEKANIYILMNQFKNAIKEFKLLIKIIPNEWKIHFHLGEVYLQIGQKNDALLSFNKAMALNPKDKNTIKHAIQNVFSINNHNNNNNCNRNHHSDHDNHNHDDDDDDDDMLDDDDDDDSDDMNDQFMNISNQLQQ